MRRGWLVLIAIFTMSIVLAAPYFSTTGTTSHLTEDQSPAFTYNFSTNVTNVDADSLVFSIEEIKSSAHAFTNATSYYWISIDDSTGVMTLNSTRDNETGIFNVSITVLNSIPEGMTSVFYFNVNATNDAPYFTGISNRSFNMSELFETIIYVEDEESNTPYSLDISFLECDLAEWSTKLDCELFNESDYTFNTLTGKLNISFTPTRDEVGYYLINFSVMDNNSIVTPYNQTFSQLFNYTVLNINSYPWFSYVCDNERNATEDAAFSCYVNVSDIDEVNNMTYSSNYNWFLAKTIEAHNVTTNFNSSTEISFTPTDVNVGNWSITISVNDTGEPIRTNSTTFYFYIDNVDDSVSLEEIINTTGYEGNTYNILLNASDNDLLITDESVYDESLTFSFVNSSGHVPEWLSLIAGSELGSYYTSYLRFTAVSSISGEHLINVSVADANGFSIDSQLFKITIISNNAPYWEGLDSVYYLNETEEFYLNLSEYAVDSDGDSLTFSYLNLSNFPSFSVDGSSGVINFTPTDIHVGIHQLYFNVTDGKTANASLVTFNVSNVNDVPFIETPLTVLNATRDLNSNIEAVEDNVTIITLWVQDDDYKIQDSQEIYYNESILVGVILEGPNSSIISFVKDDDFPSINFPNKTKYIATFTPGKSDLGNYNVTINVSDISFGYDTIYFNMTVSSINHNPVMMNLTNQTSSVDRNLYYRINATDVEDGTSEEANTNLTFAYEFLSGNSFFNETNFNINSGEINITFNSTQYGLYQINITVNDSVGAIDYEYFWIAVYENPVIDYPSITSEFSLTENQNTNLSFNASHSVGNNLTYFFYLDEVLKYNVSYYGNGTNVNWSFTPSYTDETYGEEVNLTLLVLNQIYPDINSSQSWNVSIEHANAPVDFVGHIGDKQATYAQAIEIDLSQYFSDTDYSDLSYNQTINFTVRGNSSPSYITRTESNWVLTLSSLIAIQETLNVTATDGQTNATSNLFLVDFIEPSVQTVPTSGGGGGQVPVSFKLIMPDPVSAYKSDRIVLPLRLENTGSKSFSGIKLTSVVAKDGVSRPDIDVSFDKPEISSLDRGEKEEVQMTIITNTNDVGLFEISITATSTSPKYSDWGKLYLTVKETDRIQEKLLFTEEFITENPECIELRELIEESKRLFEIGEDSLANVKAQEAIDGCKRSISQQNLPKYKALTEDKAYRYLLLSSLTVFFSGVGYYSYKRIRMRRALQYQ